MAEKDNENKRFTRVLAIYFHLDSHRYTTKAALAEKFEVSEKTIYRDIKALMATAAVQIIFVKGKGYTWANDAKIRKIQLTEEEANALIIAEQLILKNKDTSFIKHYTTAVAKVKEALDEERKAGADLLSDKTNFVKSYALQGKSNYLADLQAALKAAKLVKFKYLSYGKGEMMTRIVEPFATTNSLEEDWLLHGICRTRKAFRVFRLDRMESVEILDEHFEPQKMTLAEYYAMREKENQ